MIRRTLFNPLILIAAFTFAAPRAEAALRYQPAPASPKVNLLGETQFECGTYKGNQVEHAWRKAVNDQIQADVKSGRRAQQASLDYVYDNVWIIQDDGTLTFSGTNSFDTNLKTFLFAPAGGGVYNVTNPAFSYDAVLGSAIAPGDDGAIVVNLPFSFPFAGNNWLQMYVSGNGIVSFGKHPNPSGFYDPNDFYSDTPKIAGYYMDLNPATGGSVRVKSEATKYTVTWAAVPEYGTGNLNTVQIVLYPSGNFSLTYNGIASVIAGSPIVLGFHPGGAPPLQNISFSGGLPHVSAPGAAVYEQYYSYASPLVNEVALMQRFYSQFPDQFFQLVFFTNFAQTMGGFANELNIKNDVTGIGLDIFDSSSQYGSNGVLESRCNMNQLSAWHPDPTNRFFSKGNNFLTIMGQEAGHRWGAFVNFNDGVHVGNLILGRSDAHWSYYTDVDHSSLEGGNWVSIGGNNYQCPTRVDFSPRSTSTPLACVRPMKSPTSF